MKIDISNPATEDIIASYDVMDSDSAFIKVNASHNAFEQWRLTTHEERATHLVNIAKALRSKADAIARLMKSVQIAGERNGLLSAIHLFVSCYGTCPRSF